MNKFCIKYSKTFEKDFTKLKGRTLEASAKAIIDLEINPFTGNNIKKIKISSSGDYRLKSGDYRIIYRVKGNNILLLKVIHRKDLEKAVKAILEI